MNAQMTKVYGQDGQNWLFKTLFPYLKYEHMDTHIMHSKKCCTGSMVYIFCGRYPYPTPLPVEIKTDTPGYTSIITFQ